MLILELLSYLLEIPNDANTTLSQFGLAVQYSVKSTASWLVYIRNKQKATFNIYMPYWNLIIEYAYCSLNPMP